MNIKRNLKLAILVLLLLVTAVYFSVPFISKYLVERNLPVNIQLLKWDINFLGFNKVCVKQVTLKIDLDTIENEVRVKNACINYFSKDIEIEEILTKSQEQPIKIKTADNQIFFPISIPPILLPRIDFSSIKQLTKIGKIDVTSFQSQYTTKNKVDYNFDASNLAFNLTPDSHLSSTSQIANLSIQEIEIDRKQDLKPKQKIFHGSVEFKLGAETIDLLISDSNNTDILVFEFNQTQSQIALDLTLDQVFLKHQLNTFIPDEKINFSPSEKISIEIIRDLVLKTQNVNISSTFIQNNAIAEPISVALELLINNQPKTEIVTLQLTTKLIGNDILFEKSDIIESKQIMFNKFKSVTNVKLTTSKNELTSVDYLSNVIGIEQLAIRKTSHAEKNSQSRIAFDKLKLSVNSDSSLPLNSFESIVRNISIKGKIVGEELKAKFITGSLRLEIGKTDFDDEPSLNLNFKIDKQDDRYHSSGNLLISNFLSDAVIIDKIEKPNNQPENIKTALKGELSWNNLSATINTKVKKTHPTIHSADIKLHIEGADLITSKLDLSDFDFNSTASINDNKMTATGELDISEHRLASIELTNKDILSKENNFNLVVRNSKIQHELISQLASSFLTKFDSKNETTLSISQGTIEHDNKIQVGDKLNLKSNLTLHQFDLDINSIFLTGLNYKQNINSLEPLSLSAELDIREITFASGLLLSNISTVIEVTDDQSNSKLESTKKYANKLPDISVSNVKADIWNGEIQSKSIVIENGLLKPSTIDFKNVDLTEIIFFLDMKGLYADGDINIHLPVAQQGEKYIVKNGYFSSNKTGIIKYDSGQEQVDVEANIALHALQDFHYEKLDGTIDYNKSGAYKIKLHLLGSNPSLYDGYPIDFELNLSGELSDVFQSVFLTGDFEKSIMERAKMNHLNL